MPILPPPSSSRRPVNELFGSLIDSNSFTISNNHNRDTKNNEESNNKKLNTDSFPTNPADPFISSSSSSQTQGSNNRPSSIILKSVNTNKPSSNSYPSFHFKRFLSILFLRPKIMNNRNNSQSSSIPNNSINNNIPIVEAELVIPESESSNNNHTATPSTYFQYDEQTLSNDNNPPVPSAPAFTTITDDSPEAQEQLTSWKARYGSDIGKIQAMEEKERNRRTNANAKGYPYFEKKRIEAADNIAKRRNREGFDIRGDKYFDESGLMVARKKKEQDEAAAKAGTNGNDKKKSNYTSEGYQVSAYNTQEYDCKEYTTSEYKSIYDS